MIFFLHFENIFCTAIHWSSQWTEQISESSFDRKWNWIQRDEVTFQVTQLMKGVRSSLHEILPFQLMVVRRDTGGRMQMWTQNELPFTDRGQINSIRIRSSITYHCKRWLEIQRFQGIHKSLYHWTPAFLSLNSSSPRLPAILVIVTWPTPFLMVKC